MKHDCVCVGLTTLDILGRPINAIPKEGKTELIQQIRLTPAGTAAGPVVIASKLGLKSALISAVGNDDMGFCVKNALARQGVDITHLQDRDDMPTSTTILAVTDQGERPNFHAPGASLMLDVDEKAMETLTNTRFIHWGGVGTMLVLDGQRSTEILQQAKSKGATITCDFIAPGEQTLDALKAVLAHVDYFMPSMEEAMEVAGTSTPEDTAGFYMDLGATNCIFKWGAKGSWVATPTTQMRIPAFNVDVVDTTGCGDSYCAGFIAGLSHGFDLEKACRFATATSALVATGLGSDAGVEDFDKTLKAMENLDEL
ncbi:MAG: sugar kinase [Thermodesulfobacteriota bacterium]|nr:sugar kinase [Thermodesulfobacteriota bacterium]